ncbi:hypothetical protein GW17_00061062 [Ensete ventricosum]|nr:hypothetical protein GW17_00061062 [Ensete ventricosum]RZS15230.1 hypothetical protein BHM03_00047047 [Ensete ventricosum]
MLPLRFPNSGIKDKVFAQKIGFKLRVMRLNHVESLYAFSLHFCNERSEERGGPATARPYAVVITDGLPVRGDARPRPGRRGNARSQPVEGWRPQRHRLQARCPPAREVPPEGSGAYCRGSCPCTGRQPTTRSPTARARVRRRQHRGGKRG